MRSGGQAVIASALAALALVSLFRYLSRPPTTEQILSVAAGVAVWGIVKGELLRYLGGARPYRSGLVSNAASELSGLGFPLSGLGLPWPALGASLVISAAIEWLALVVMGTARVKPCLAMALYINIFAHVLLAGVHVWSDNRVGGGALVVASFLVFILPIFVVHRPVLPRR